VNGAGGLTVPWGDGDGWQPGDDEGVPLAARLVAVPAMDDAFDVPVADVDPARPPVAGRCDGCSHRRCFGGSS
jgi:hypothetical protein